MSVKETIVNKIIAHPKLFTFGIFGAITLVMAAASVVSDVQYASATPDEIIGGPLRVCCH